MRGRSGAGNARGGNPFYRMRRNRRQRRPKSFSFIVLFLFIVFSRFGALLSEADFRRVPAAFHGFAGPGCCDRPFVRVFTARNVAARAVSRAADGISRAVDCRKPAGGRFARVCSRLKPAGGRRRPVCFRLALVCRRRKAADFGRTRAAGRRMHAVFRRKAAAASGCGAAGATGHAGRTPGSTLPASNATLPPLRAMLPES